MYSFDDKIKQDVCIGKINMLFKTIYVKCYENDKYYVILDGKNHFIRKTGLDYFIKNDKYKIFFTQKTVGGILCMGKIILINGFNYFNITRQSRC